MTARDDAMPTVERASIAAMLERRRAAQAGGLAPMIKRFVPWMVFAAIVAYLAAVTFARPLGSRNGFDLAAFRRLPVSVSGRVQPFDTVARLALLKIRESTSVPLDGGQARQVSATSLDPDEWLLEVLARPDRADTRKIFPVEDRELLAKLALTPQRGTTYCAFTDFTSKVAAIGRDVQRIAKVKARERAGWERELLRLQARLVIYERLKNSVQPNSLLQRGAKGHPIVFDFAREFGKYRVDLAEALRVADLRRQGTRDTLDVPTEQRIRAFAAQFQGVSALGLVAFVPPLRSGGSSDRWSTTGSAIVNSARGEPLSPAVAYLASMTSAYARDDAEAFNDRLAKYLAWLASNGYARAIDRAGLETFYNDLQPFNRALYLYAAATILLLAAWRRRSVTAYRTGALLVLFAFALHGGGLIVALRLAGRPSVVAVIGWAVALAGLAVEAVRRRGMAVAVAATCAFGALVWSYALTPAGTIAVARTLLDRRTLTATAAAVGAFALAALVRRFARSRRTMAGRERLRLGYVADRRGLRTQ